MASTPAISTTATTTTATSSPAKAPAPTPTVLDNWITLFKAHEKFLMFVGILLLAVRFFGAGLTAWVNHDKAQLTADQAKSAELAQQNTNNAQTTAALIATVASDNAALAAQAKQRATETKQQQTADQTLTLPDIGIRWAGLIDQAPANFTPTPNGIAVSDAASRATVVQLETVPTLQADLKGLQQAQTNTQNVVNQQLTQITGLNATIVADNKTCQQKIDTLNAQNKKKAWKWFKIGFVAGSAATVAVEVAVKHVF